MEASAVFLSSVVCGCGSKEREGEKMREKIGDREKARYINDIKLVNDLYLMHPWKLLQFFCHLLCVEVRREKERKNKTYK